MIPLVAGTIKMFREESGAVPSKPSGRNQATSNAFGMDVFHQGM